MVYMAVVVLANILTHTLKPLYYVSSDDPFYIVTNLKLQFEEYYVMLITYTGYHDVMY